MNASEACYDILLFVCISCTVLKIFLLNQIELRELEVNQFRIVTSL